MFPFRLVCLRLESGRAYQRRQNQRNFHLAEKELLLRKKEGVRVSFSRVRPRLSIMRMDFVIMDGDMGHGSLFVRCLPRKEG